MPAKVFGEHPGDGHRGVGEAGRAGEPVRRQDVGADRDGDPLTAAGTGGAEDHQQQPERSRSTSPSQHPAAITRGGSRGERAEPEHQVGEERADDRADDLGDDEHDGVRVSMTDRARSTSVTSGLKAAETGCSARISATSAAPVTTLFSSSCSPTLSGERRAAAMPEPTMAVSRNAVPMNSASACLASGSCGVARLRRPDQGGEIRESRGLRPVVDPDAALVARERPASCRTLRWWLIVGCDSSNASVRSQTQASPPSCEAISDIAADGPGRRAP